jgi:hypothetical protein
MLHFGFELSIFLKEDRYPYGYKIFRTRFLQSHFSKLH